MVPTGAAAQAPTVTGTVKALPQFVYGGGWSTSLYFGNTAADAANVALKFFGEDGSPLNVPAAGGSPMTLNLAPRGSATVEPVAGRRGGHNHGL
ncbi:MAG: hypothetical protein HXY18_07140 [Bryobacteraceae bacterium]|nr:hypothetical protein [Bryobacteraceae bacterium]